MTDKQLEILVAAILYARDDSDGSIDHKATRAMGEALDFIASASFQSDRIQGR